MKEFGMKVSILLVTLCFGAASANYCTQTLRGSCISLYSGLYGGQCDAGHVYTLNFCGAMMMCCYYMTQPVVHPTYLPVTLYPQYPLATNPPSLTAAPGHTSSSNAVCGITEDPGHRMVGGSLAHLGQFPWQISLQYTGAGGRQHICGGTLVDPQWVLTAAHCFQHTGLNAGDYLVGLGLQDQKSAPSSNFVHVNHIYPKEDFIALSQYASMQNDLAMVKLSKPIDVSGRYVRLACLPEAQDYFDADVCVVSGWGSHRFAPPGSHVPVSEQLEYITATTMTNTLCGYYHDKKAIHSTTICAGTSTGGKGPCQGDSGGPLACKKNGVWKLAGIVSWGVGCAEAGKPGIYTRVTSYLHWIQDTIKYF